eukprot:scaffold376006_cov15-Prasinocladus_malaysianus.AAC.1
MSRQNPSKHIMPPVGPVTVETETGEDFALYFPWELNNTDYLRRVLAHVTFALKPIYETAVTCDGIARMKTGGQSGQEVEPNDLDSYYALRHIETNLEYYATKLRLTSDLMKDTVQWLKEARNKLAHESLQG